MTDLVIREKTERDFLGRAVHDLKNPLAVVRASLEWLQVELTDRPDALEAIGDATAASERLVVIVDDLDSLARLNGDRPGGARFGVFPLVSTVVRQTGARLGRMGLSVKAIGNDATELVGDARLFERALTALVDATARGAASGSTIEVTVARVVTSSGAKPAVEIAVAVRGAIDIGAPGLSLDPLDTSGLGVFVAQRVTEAHGGTLAVVPTTLLPRLVVRIPV